MVGGFWVLGMQPVVPVCPAGAHRMKADVMGVWHTRV